MSEQEYNVGDLVEAVKGEKFARSRLIESQYESSSGALGLYLDGFTHIPFVNGNEKGRDGWTFSTIEKAKSPLPTEPGIYFPRKEFEPGVRVVKLQRGEWSDASGKALDAFDLEWLKGRNANGTLTRLEPVAETAKRVLERVNELSRPIHYSKLDKGTFRVVVTEKIATEFGVTS